MTIILMIMMMIRAMFMTVTAEISDCRDCVWLMTIAQLLSNRKHNCVRQLHPYCGTWTLGRGFIFVGQNHHNSGLPFEESRMHGSSTPSPRRELVIS